MSHNTWIHRVARVAVVRPLMRTRVTPNQLTTARLLTGAAGAALVAFGDASWPQVGALIFLVSMVFDRADGDLARLTGRTSPGGHVYDMAADAISNAALFVGLGVAESCGPIGLWAIAMGIAAGAGVAAVFGMVVLIERERGERAAELPVVAGFDADDAMLFVPLGILLGWSTPLLAAAAIGGPIFVLFFLFRFHRQLFARPAWPRDRGRPA